MDSLDVRVGLYLTESVGELLLLLGEGPTPTTAWASTIAGESVLLTIKIFT